MRRERGYMQLAQRLLRLSIAASLGSACAVGGGSPQLARQANDNTYVTIRAEIHIEGRPNQYDGIFINIINDTSRAVCVPEYLTLVSRAKIRSLDFLTITDLESGLAIETSGRRLHPPNPEQLYFVIPPNETGKMLDYSLEEFFSLQSGRSYRAVYKQQAFFCDSFNFGYPQATKSSLSSTVDQGFERDSTNTLWISGEVIFQHI